ncbi:Txe/YoeB family addiction module toxin [bacterium]|nr:Txe/YoeB family addiction module toxin [candidate division CSSED10-310 bacterium]
MWQIRFTRQAQKDARKIYEAGLQKRVESILEILRENPWQPPFEKLIGDLSGACSRRINIHHRLVCQVMEPEKIVKIIRMWTHYQ